MVLVAAKTGLSPSLLNKGFVFEGTGAEIAALGTTTGVQVARCTISGSGFLADHCYFRRVDGTWEVLNLAKHTHDQNDDDSGGLMSDIEYANINKVYKKEMWGWFGNETLNEFTGTGAGVFASLPTGSTKLKTGTENTSYANALTGGRRHDWASPSQLLMNMATTATSAVIVRAGVNVDSLSGSNTSRACYGIEWCDSTGANWQIASSDGTTRSLLGTTAPGTTADSQIYRMEHIPGSSGSIKLTTGMSTSPFWVKTSNPPPATGWSSHVQTVSVGIKTQDTTSKELQVWGFAFVGVPSFGDGFS